MASWLDPEARFLHCPHPAGPPICWCRPPLPGLPLLFAREAQVDLSRSVLVGTGAPHRNLASALGCRYEE
jgi:histidinol phosphatase-like enzyme